MAASNVELMKSPILFFSLALSTAGTGWSAIAACSTTALGTHLSTMGMGSTANGCAEVDLSYSNLSLTGTSSSGRGTTPTTATIDLYSSGTAASGNNAGPVDLFTDGFASITGASGTSTEAGMVGMQAAANTGGSYTGGTYPTPSNPNLHWAYTGLQLNPSAAAVGAGDSITIVENFCLNATSATVAGNCTAANHGTLTATFTASTTPTYACVFGTSGVCASGTSSSVSFAGLTLAATTIAITEAVTLDRVGATTVTLTNVEDIFSEGAVSPEPGTFGLIGVALIGLGAIGYRKRKR